MEKLFKNPYVNSVYAEAYILGGVTVMDLLTEPNTPDTFLAPVVALSLLVLSAAVMGFLFFGKPLQLYLDGEKKQAVSFFAKTVFGFAILTAVVLLLFKIFE